MTEPQKTALVIVAHPDDAEFGCGGTAAAWAAEGWEVTFVICTDASGGGADDASDVSADARRTITETRKAEQRAATRILGVHDVVFLDHPDGRIVPSIDLRRDIVRLLRTVKPTRLVCQSPDRSWDGEYRIGRYHPDHLAVGTAVISAMYPASQNSWDFPELLAEGLLPHKVRELYVMGAPTINFAVDITASWDTKVEGLRAHASQLAPQFDEIIARVREWAVDNGKLHGFDLAEVFHRTYNY